MNTTPRPPTAYPTEFRQIIREKSANFVGREFVFAAINNFLSRQNRGYFTIVGAPGSGKSAILAKYASENPQVIYYNAEVAGKNRAEEFLAIVCSELLRRIGNGNASEGDWFLSLLLQKISDLLSPDERLIIAIDGLDRIDANHQPPGTNLFYLPRYLPDKVYFILTRRPFLREKSGLLIEAPFQVLDLEEYPQENREDVREYVINRLTNPPILGNRPPNPPILGGTNPVFHPNLGSSPPNPPILGGTNPVFPSNLGNRPPNPPILGGTNPVFPPNLENRPPNPPILGGTNSQYPPLSPPKVGGLGGLTTHNINQEEFIEQLIDESESNFMYISEILPIIAEKLVAESLDEELRNPVSPKETGFLSPGLEAYYQNHWQRMIGNSLDSIELAVINILSQQKQPISAELIAEMINEDEYDVEEILENWRELLHLQTIGGENYYSFYHCNFRDWLSKQVI